MSDNIPALPAHRFRTVPPGLWVMARRGVSDPASVIPDTILHEPAVQLPGPGAPLVVADPALVHQVLNDRDQFFTRDRLLRRLFRRSWGKGIAGAEGEHWQVQRRAASPVFRPLAVEANGSAFATAASRAATSCPHGQPIELSRLAALIVAEIVFTTLIDAEGAVDTTAVAEDVPAYVRRIAAFGIRDLLPLPESWHDWLSGIGRDPAVRRLRGLAAALAAQRAGNVDKNDLIARLKGVGPIEDNIRGLFPAAMDTTVVAISWTLYTLALRPEWQARVAQEGRAAGEQWKLGSLPVTHRVVREVLRLYPPAPLLIRSAASDSKLGEFRLAKGQPVSLCIYAMHRHRARWQCPDDFDPDRFLPDQGPHLGWMPFGSGPRVCIAAQFALTEIAVVVARLLAELKLAPVAPEPHLTLQVTTRSTTGLNVVAQSRA